MKGKLRVPFLALAVGISGWLASPPAEAASVKSVQTGTVAMSTATVTVGAAQGFAGVTDTAKSMVVCSNRTNSSNPSNRVTCILSGTTTLTIQSGAANASEVVRWYVVEFEGGVFVQRSTQAFTTAQTTLNVPIPTAVDLSKSFVLISERDGASTNQGIDDQWAFRARLTTSTNIELSRLGSGTLAPTVAWQVVQMEGASVQRGLTTIAAAASSATAAISSVTTGASFLVMSRRGVVASAGIETQYQVRGEITNATTLTFSRDSTTNTVDIAWEVVTLSDGTSVQRGAAAAATTETTLNATLSPAVILAQSVSFASARGGVDVNSDLDSTSWTASITTTTNLQLQRGSAQSVDSNIAWEVVQFFRCSAVGDASYVSTNAQLSLPTQAIVRWSSPSPVLILRKTGTAFGATERPDNGKAYTVGATGGELGGSTVVYNGSAAASSLTDLGPLTAGTTYFYKVFPKAGTGAASCYAPGIEVNARPQTGVSAPSWSYMMAGGSILKGGVAGTSTVYTSSNASRIISLNTGDGTQTWDPLATNAQIQGWLTWLPVHGYLYRGNIPVTAGAAAVPSGYSVSLAFDHAGLVAAGKSLANGDDIRVFYWDGAGWVQLDRVLENGSAWNSAATTIWFKTQAAIGAGATDSNYYLFYGNASAVSPPANPSNVYVFFEDFAWSDAPSNHGWTVRNATWSANGSVLTSSGTATEFGVISHSAATDDAIIEARVRGMSDVCADCRHTGVGLRFSGAGAGYVGIGYDYDTTRLTIVGQTAWQSGNSLLAFVGQTLAADTWHRIKFQAIGTSLSDKAWVDGQPEPGWQLTVTNGTYASGTEITLFGGWASPKHSEFDWLRVRKAVSPEPGAALAAEEALSGAIVIGGDQSGRVYSVDATLGVENWRVDLKTVTGSDADAVQDAVSVQVRADSNAAFQAAYTDDVIFVATRNSSGTPVCGTANTNNKLLALRAGDGAVLWTFNLNCTSTVDAIVGQPWVDYTRNYVYVASRAGASGTQPSLWVINGLDGTLVTSFALGHFSTSPTVSSTGAALYVGNEAGSLHAIDLSQTPPVLKWTSAVGAAITGFVWEDAATAGRLYFSANDNTVRCVLDTGSGATPVWTTAVPAPSTPLLVDPKLFVGSSDGTLHQLRVSDGVDEKQVTVGDGSAAVGDASTDLGSEVFVGIGDPLGGKIFKFPLTGGSL
ncbi:MAG: PQQ-binding-like beta-propeller repeat protein [Candidatus Rokuibacteriota bacterium]